jgi:hypothetical protein
MKYMLMVFENEQNFADRNDMAAMNGLLQRHIAFQQEIKPVHVGGAGLKGVATATTIRSNGGKQVVHDGPFAEIKEQLGGFYLIDVPDLDAAIEIARKVPLMKDGAIEIRPLMTVDAKPSA